ncbi:hypothetical protein [Sporolactobacillus pectinivorans]|nr:hypothetical protein [Sporolactobacillus pectinivorans]
MSTEYRSFIELFWEVNKRLDSVERSLSLLNELCDRIEEHQSMDG